MRNKPKRPALTVNASHPFPLKSRCKHCGSNKLSYSWDFNYPYSFPDTRIVRDRCSFEEVNSWLRACHDDKELSVFKRLPIRLEPQHSIAFKGYDPKNSKGWADDHTRGHIVQYVIVIACDDCDMQAWAYMNSYVLEAPENKHRKACMDCPHKISAFNWKKR